jgi:hypothetical protein
MLIVLGLGIITILSSQWTPSKEDLYGEHLAKSEQRRLRMDDRALHITEDKHTLSSEKEAVHSEKEANDNHKLHGGKCHHYQTNFIKDFIEIFQFVNAMTGP